MNKRFLLLFSLFFIQIVKLFSAQIICKTDPLIDEEFFIEVNDLIPEQIVTLECNWIDIDQIQWVSKASYQADKQGTIQLAEQAPISGTYEGIDPMGLFWSMQMKNIILAKNLPEEDPKKGYFLLNELKVLDNKEEIAKETIYRIIKTPEVEFIPVFEDGLIGNLFLPPSDKPLPVVIVLTGSNGGIQAVPASVLASHGIAAFALAYTGIGDLPPSVEEVPLEYFEKAFEWIENHPRLSGKIALYGSSRGAELSLLLGCMFPEKIQKIVAQAPSSVVLSADAWTYENESILPPAPYFVDINNDLNGFDSTREEPHSIRIYRERGLHLEKDRYDAAMLPVEKIQCPILLISGGDDQLGPCTLYAQQILDRLDTYQSNIHRIHLDYPNAGHSISMPYFPRVNIFCEEGLWMTMGGTPFADEQASRDSWQKVLEFLRAEFQSEKSPSN